MRDKLPNKFFIEVSPMISIGNARFRHADILGQLAVLNVAAAELTQAILNDPGHSPHEVPTFSMIEIESDFLGNKHKRSFLVSD